MRNRMTWAASCIAVVIIAASGLTSGHAQTAAQPKAQAKADECLSRPGATAPKGSHWFYRIERPSQRRCWYLGPANQKVRAERTTSERAAPAERRAVPIPTPAPSELRAGEQIRSETSAAIAPQPSATSAGPVEASQYSAAWPAGSSASIGAPSDRDAPATAANNDSVEEVATTTEAQAETMPLVWPAMTAADRAATQADTAPGLGHLLIFLAATVAFVAIAVRTVLKFVSPSKRRVPARPPTVRAEPVIRRRLAERPEASIEAMSEPAIARLREVAKRWDTPTRVPRQPRIPAYEVDSDYEVQTAPPLRRRAVA